MEHYSGYIRKPFYYETDQMGIIHHSNYIRWFEEARTDLLEYLGFPYTKIEEIGLIIPVLEVSCTYKQMIHYGDTVRIDLFIEKYTGTRLDFRYEIHAPETNDLLTIGTSKHCFLTKESNRLVKLAKVNSELDALFTEYTNFAKTYDSQTK
ncbi:MAG: acyl-CoA thioesterase [Enterococcus sp.]